MPGQAALFDGTDDVAAHAASAVAPAERDTDLLALGQRLQQRFGGRLFLGTSSWHFPGWAGLVWQRPHPAPLLSRQGLRAYAQHPLFNTVSLDRAFYRPLQADEFQLLATQVGADFRFVVKAPALLTDAQLRDPQSGAPRADNPQFLDAALAADAVARPLAQGLGERLGVLVLQLSPLPAPLLHDSARLHARLAAVFQALREHLPASSLLALEPRDSGLLTPEWADFQRQHAVRPVLSLHDRMPAVADQLPLQRRLWPGDLVCRWNLQRGQRYAQARDAWAPFDRLQAPDPDTRAVLVRVIRATLDAGHRAFVTINNKAEGSAPWSVRALAEALDAEL